MPIDEELLALLACPSADHAPLTQSEDGAALVCTACGTSYPIQDGIPVLLTTDATPGPNGIGVVADAGTAD